MSDSDGRRKVAGPPQRFKPAKPVATGLIKGSRAPAVDAAHDGPTTLATGAPALPEPTGYAAPAPVQPPAAAPATAPVAAPEFVASAPELSVPPEPAPAPIRKKLTANLPIDLHKRMMATYMATRYQEDDESLTQMVGKAIEAELERREDVHNRGARFPTTSTVLRGGRPPKL